MTCKTAGFCLFSPLEQWLCQKGIKRGLVPGQIAAFRWLFCPKLAENDKKEPDRVGSEVFVLQKVDDSLGEFFGRVLI